ncbi:MAG: hypothetical protein IPL97_09540 [Niastella sp.]|nr:hypothetical protein [Niastella sp.]
MLKKIIKISLFAVAFLLNVSTKSYAQFFFKLHYQEFNIEYRPSKIPDTAIFSNLKDYPNQRLIIYISSEKGESHFELFSKKNKVVIKGEYSNSTDTLTKYKFSKSLGFTDGKSHYNVSTLKYFQPLQSGTWYYFNEKQKLIRKDEYLFTHD